MKAIFFAVGALGILAPLLAAPNPADTDIRNYKRWSVANENAVKMSDIVSALCAPATLKQSASTAKESPHRQYFLRAYVNDIGEKQFLHKANPYMPVGTIIVKEKLASVADKHHVLCTVMTKRERGYDSTHGDWEYSLVDANGTVKEKGRITRCISCHDEQKSTDYLFRSYFQVK